MLNRQDILDAYDQTTAATLATWQAHPDCGLRLPPYKNADQLAVTSGCRLQAAGALAALHAELLDLAKGDPLLDVTPTRGLHVSFMALTWNQYDSTDDLPPGLDEVRALFNSAIQGLTYILRDLRLLPLNNALLLAGIPDEATCAAREQFAHGVLQSAWASLLRDRYRGVNRIPPLFWHTTLARYDAEFAPSALRDLYFRYRELRLPELNLGQPDLAAATYNWSRQETL